MITPNIVILRWHFNQLVANFYTNTHSIQKRKWNKNPTTKTIHQWIHIAKDCSNYNVLFLRVKKKHGINFIRKKKYFCSFCPFLFSFTFCNSLMFFLFYFKTHMFCVIYLRFSLSHYLNKNNLFSHKTSIWFIFCFHARNEKKSTVIPVTKTEI